MNRDKTAGSTPLNFELSGKGFNVGLRTSEVTAQYLIVHEFIKRLHSRYRKEGIDIPTPVQTVVYHGPAEPAGTTG